MKGIKKNKKKKLLSGDLKISTTIGLKRNETKIRHKKR